MTFVGRENVLEEPRGPSFRGLLLLSDEVFSTATPIFVALRQSFNGAHKADVYCCETETETLSIFDRLSYTDNVIYCDYRDQAFQ